MTPRQTPHVGTCIAGALWCLLVAASPACAQGFFEAGGGWDYFAPPAAGESYNQAYNIRLSLGRQLSPRMLIRFDIIANQFQERTQVYPPCAYPGCNGPQYEGRTGGVTGFTGNAIFNVDARG